MKKQFWKRELAALLGLMIAVQAPLGTLAPVMTAWAYTEKAGRINASTLNVRSGAGTGYASVAKLARGTDITVINETTGSDGRTWYQIRFTQNGSTASGYVLSTYVKFSVDYTYSADFESQLSAQGFPESYKNALRELHTLYPNWVFEAENTGLDWNTAVQNEMVLPRSLIDTNSISSYKSLADGAYNWDTSTWTGFDGSTWVAASQEILSYYMDPRNFLDEVYIFQFLSHTYDASQQTKEGLQKMVQGTFLAGSVITNGSGSGTSSSSGSGSGTSPVISAGPGASGSSSESGTVSSGTVVSPAEGSGSSDGVSSSPSVTLTAPQASVSVKKTALLGATVVTGVMPGSDTGASESVTETPDAGNSAESSQTTSSPVITSGGPSQAASSPTVTGGSTDTATEQTSLSYVDMIMEAAEQSGVNPYVLASMILQEQGTDGRGRSISGTVSGYSGYYNYFNVGAYASDGMGAIERGMWYASQNDSYGRPWNTPEKSIVGGARFYGDNYVNAGQDTFYLKKYNVQGSNKYKHQYMTNVDGAADEAALFAEAYNTTLRDSALRFRIPVYSNMPENPCPKPTVSGSPNNKLKGLGVEGFTLTPTFARDTYSYSLIVDTSVTSIQVTANVIDSTATVSGAGAVSLTGDATDVTVQVTAQNGSIREYKIHVVRQANGPTGSVSTGETSSGTVTQTPGTTVIGPGGNSVSSGVVTAGQSQSSGADAVQASPGGSSVTIIN